MKTESEARVSVVIADMETDELLSTFPEGPRLLGTRCGDCGREMIGTRVVCSTCVSSNVSTIALPSTGTLYSFTRLHVGGDGVRPLGYVDLDNDVRTLADIREGDTPLEPGIRVELGVEGDNWFFARAAGETKGQHHD
ncbi:hypothetical protein AU252_12540 [Pseudarthrobacter sulfonivorans]|uniref:ChsH2 C-terminal OB-fold domain-containing protein n=1 Tax=Pseudarthrobacter sulfonivorans TaxID=121292 RepID=A0A0U3QBX6_9MICC|nr:OB-fold domain-containing protein [Pseudarthrobacter sulfonivorans]ALV41885.1 hypothetical protein AU252_12540 [Pseudarthrobacter sulfonivorans]